MGKIIEIDRFASGDEILKKVGMHIHSPGMGRSVCRVCGKRRYVDRMEFFSTTFGPMMVCKTGVCADKMADLVRQLDTVDMKLFYRIFRRK